MDKKRNDEIANIVAVWFDIKLWKVSKRLHLLRELQKNHPTLSRNALGQGQPRGVLEFGYMKHGETSLPENSIKVEIFPGCFVFLNFLAF